MQEKKRKKEKRKKKTFLLIFNFICNCKTQTHKTNPQKTTETTATINQPTKQAQRSGEETRVVVRHHAFWALTGCHLFCKRNSLSFLVLATSSLAFLLKASLLAALGPSFITISFSFKYTAGARPSDSQNSLSGPLSSGLPPSKGKERRKRE